VIDRLAIIGVGLIGGSLSLALKKVGQVGEVVGYARSESIRQQALELGVIDRSAGSIADVIKDADIIFLAVPMGAMSSVLIELAPHITDRMIITDGGSAKAQVIESARVALGERFSQFVAGHPIAGTEKSGPSAAFANLYNNHRVVLTPVAETNSESLEKVRAMWQLTGAEVVDMSAEHHDKVLAATSHLPHLLAFNLVGMLAKSTDCDEILRFAAGGFRDFSRIASSDPVMWRDICLSNSAAILELLNDYRRGLDSLEQAIINNDGDQLVDVFKLAKQARDTRFAEPSLNDNSEA
jgi:prephenate dehydrogenase